LGGAGAAVVYLRAYRLDLTTFADLATPGLAIGHALGRMGCFMGGCCHGRPTHVPWGVFFERGPFFMGPVGVPLHPVQLYEALLELFLAFVAWRVLGKARKGAVFGLWLTGYAAARLVFELLFRGDDRGFAPAGIPPSALVSIGMLMAGSVWLWLSQQRGLTRELKLGSMGHPH